MTDCKYITSSLYVRHNSRPFLNVVLVAG